MADRIRSIEEFIARANDGGSSEGDDPHARLDDQAPADVRARLEHRRAEHVRAIERIDDMLSQLQDGPSKAAGRPASVSTLILGILRENPGIRTSRLIEAAQARREKLLARDVFTNLNRLKHRRLIRTEGTARDRRYFATGDAAAEDARR